MTAHQCPPAHDHAATTVCYIQHRCRCAPCREARTEMERHRRRQIAYGTYKSGRVPAGPVRAHVEALQTAGLGWKRVAELAGVSNSTVSNLLYGRPRGGRRERAPRVLRRVAEAILAVEPTLESLRPGALIPNTGFVRRAEALAWVGHSFSRQAARLGVSAANFHSMLNGRQVTVRHHLGMCDLFDEWWNVAPATGTWHEKSSVTRTRNMARARGFAPPLAWNNIDDPQTRPAGVAA